MQARIGVELQPLSLLTWALVGRGCSKPRLELLSPRKHRGTHGTGDRVGPTCGRDGCGKYKFPFPLTGFEPRIVQHVATRYTVCHIDNAEEYLNLVSGSFLTQNVQLIFI
jgi:hypothetical protein